ncbi:hypothetical protein ACTG9Q_13950 [Actinokineospora sp. 24-640]
MADLDIPTNFPWLRSDPAGLTGEPPDKVSGVGGGRWEQVFIEWLRGATEGIPNAQFVSDTEPFDKVFAEYQEISFPSTKAERRTDLVNQFRVAYGMFRYDIGRIQSAVAARVKEIKAAAKTAGEKVPSDRDARKQAGHETAKAAVRKQMTEQGAALGNINVALVASLQLKTFQTTALQNFNNALNGFGEAKWDVVPEDESPNAPTKPSPEKAEALEALSAAGTAMFQSYGRVSSAIAQITKFDGADIPDTAAEELTESILEFGLAIAAMADSMGQAARLFGKWARRTTAAFISENFASIYPGVAIGFFALNTIALAGAAVASSFPGFGPVGTAVQTSLSMLQTATITMSGWYQRSDPEVQKKYALREFQITDEYRDGFFHRADKAKKAVDAFGEKIKDATINRPLNYVADGVRQVANATLGQVRTEDVIRHAGTAGELLAPVIEVAMEEAGVPSFDPVDLLIDGVPYLGTAKSAAGMFFEVAALYVAVHSELVDSEGVTAEDRARIEGLIDAPPQNEGFQLFDRGLPVTLDRIEYPVVYVHSGAVGFSLNLETNYVHIVDEALLSADILGYARKWAKKPPNDDNGLRFHGAVYTPIWDSWQLDFGVKMNSPFHVRLQAEHSTASETKVVNLVVAVDLNFEEVAVIESDYVPRPEGLDAVVEYNAAPPADGKFAALSSDNIKARFAGQLVTLGATEYTLSGSGEITFTPAADWTSLAFTMRGVDTAGNGATVHLEYAPQQALRAIKADADDPGASVKDDLAAAGSLIAANEAKQNTPEAQAKLTADRALLAAGQAAEAKIAAKAAKTAAEQAPKNAKKAGEALSAAKKAVDTTTAEAVKADATAKAARAKADATPDSPKLAAEAEHKAALAEEAAQRKADAVAAVAAAAQAKADADAAISATKADADAKATASVLASANKVEADKAKTTAKARVKAAKAPKQKLKITLAQAIS